MIEYYQVLFLCLCINSVTKYDTITLFNKLFTQVLQIKEHKIRSKLMNRFSTSYHIHVTGFHNETKQNADSHLIYSVILSSMNVLTSDTELTFVLFGGFI